jgi:BNR repeat-like domain
LVTAAAAGVRPQQWLQPRSHEQQLPESVDCWEPAMATGPTGQVYVVAGHRRGMAKDKDFEQQQVIWRSQDRGVSFEAPVLITSEGHSHFDQRIAVDGKGTIYVSYMDRAPDERGRSRSRLRLARSRDGGRTFSPTTVTTTRVNDKPELAVSRDGRDLYIVYTSSPGPAVVASHDGGDTWTEPAPVVANEARHFWPEALAVGADGGVWLAVPSMSDADIAQGKQTDVTLHVFQSSDRGGTWKETAISTSPRLPAGCPHNPACPVKVNSISIAVDDRSRAHVLYTEGTTPKEPYGLFHTSSSDGGRTWSTRQVVSAPPRPQSGDTADHDYITMAASGERVCAVWVDDRLGALNVWSRCSTDAGRSWGAETLLSDREEGAAYKSARGFTAFYGHYGGAAIDASGRLYAVWGAGETGYRTGTVWVNRVEVAGSARP